MAKLDWLPHKALFFVGKELPLTTHRLACGTFEMCKKFVKRGDFIFVKDLDSVEVTLQTYNDRVRTFLVNGAHCDYALLQKLNCFSNEKAIVDVNLDDGYQEGHHGTESVLKEVTGVPIIQLTDMVVAGDHRTRILWILDQLKKIDQPPIPATLIEKVLATNKDRATVPAKVLTTT